MEELRLSEMEKIFPPHWTKEEVEEIKKGDDMSKRIPEKQFELLLKMFG